ncbi:MAG: hypothetical protein FWF66_05285, partial [Candidatus Bathyarchaeota archaeon]|nr:hypothetical protein [Candidatus Termiticorpusculum sp.]
VDVQLDDVVVCGVQLPNRYVEGVQLDDVIGCGVQLPNRYVEGVQLDDVIGCGKQLPNRYVEGEHLDDVIFDVQLNDITIHVRLDDVIVDGVQLSDVINGEQLPDVFLGSKQLLRITIVEPTCTEEGYTITRNILTGSEEYSDFVPATGHSFEKFIYDDGHAVNKCTVCGLETDLDEPPTVLSATVSAFVTKLNGNQNDLTITITEKLSNGATNIIEETLKISNNAKGTYPIGSYNVYVATSGNTRIDECYII